jgi:hypothetical protein
MAQAQDTPSFTPTEEAITVLFCLIDDAYHHPSCPMVIGYKNKSRSPEIKTLPLSVNHWCFM